MTAGTTDKIKGRAKEAAGALIGDEKLKREGRVDQTVGKAKRAVDQVIDKARNATK